MTCPKINYTCPSLCTIFHKINYSCPNLFLWYGLIILVSIRIIASIICIVTILQEHLIKNICSQNGQTLQVCKIGEIFQLAIFFTKTVLQFLSLFSQKVPEIEFGHHFLSIKNCCYIPILSASQIFVWHYILEKQIFFGTKSERNWSFFVWKIHS